MANIFVMEIALSLVGVLFSIFPSNKMIRSFWSLSLAGRFLVSLFSNLLIATLDFLVHLLLLSLDSFWRRWNLCQWRIFNISPALRRAVWNIPFKAFSVLIPLITSTLLKDIHPCSLTFLCSVGSVSTLYIGCSLDFVFAANKTIRSACWSLSICGVLVHHISSTSRVNLSLLTICLLLLLDPVESCKNMCLWNSSKSYSVSRRAEKNTLLFVLVDLILHFTCTMLKESYPCSQSVRLEIENIRELVTLVVRVETAWGTSPWLFFMVRFSSTGELKLRNHQYVSTVLLDFSELHIIPYCFLGSVLLAWFLGLLLFGMDGDTLVKAHNSVYGLWLCFVMFMYMLDMSKDSVPALTPSWLFGGGTHVASLMCECTDSKRSTVSSWAYRMATPSIGFFLGCLWARHCFLGLLKIRFTWQSHSQRQSQLQDVYIRKGLYFCIAIPFRQFICNLFSGEFLLRRTVTFLIY